MTPPQWGIVCRSGSAPVESIPLGRNLFRCHIYSLGQNFISPNYEPQNQRRLGVFSEPYEQFQLLGGSSWSSISIGIYKEVGNVKKPFTPPREVHVQVTHSMPPEKIAIFDSLRGWAEQNILVHLKPVEKCWQPTDFLPDPASEGFDEQVKELRERCKEIPDDYFVVLIGDMITEEALPTYQTMINTLDAVRDETGASLTPWAIWTRAWTAEENRHGDLLNKYLYLSGRVDMKQIEKTIQYLIGSGMMRSAMKQHIPRSNGAIMAIGDMMKKKISMPAHLMYDGKDDNLFEHFSAVAQRLGVYTAKDYADILEFLVVRWEVEKLTGLSSEGRRAQDYVCGLAPRIRKLEERAQARAKQRSPVPFSWIFGKEIKT
ncbi:hypothetical protein RND71_022163 [Anisodus tanguticus]|uniref:Acyl-[acyl-carrier-protein] desaturase n=1 Tax=Anisodus tanguticus TaxID=243964 RepID=A0AAE1VFX8_9SOLA|nr:hypothetical protein RND71_022163 [Anisodus tanguticus]